MKTSVTPAIISTWSAWALWALVSASGCSSAPTRTSSTGEVQNSAAAQGPAVAFARTEPGTVELNRDFQPMRPAEVLADVKDFASRIDNVMLQFSGIPLEVPMENVGGTTWRAQLTPRQLEMLAVSGQTIKYKANVVAHDENGKVGKTEQPVDVSVKTPDVAGVIGASSNAG